jgi:hypothetical protein
MLTPIKLLIAILTTSMANFSALFWVAVFMQQALNYSAFSVAVHLLPQALVSILVSPLIGVAMRKINGVALVAAALVCSIASNIVLIFVQAGGTYASLILPSIMLNTLGLDWMTNIGSVSYLASSFASNISDGRVAVRTVHTPATSPIYRCLLGTDGVSLGSSVGSCRYYNSVVII